MKRKFFNWMAVTSVALAAACSKTETTTSQTERGADTSKKIEVEYSYNDKPKLVTKLKSELADVNDEIKRMGDKIASSSDKAAEEAKPKLEQLKEKAKNLDLHIDKVQNSTEATWEDVKEGSKKALDDVKAGFNEARAWAAEKIAPK
jgi:archaellum component FlaC